MRRRKVSQYFQKNINKVTGKELINIYTKIEEIMTILDLYQKH